LNLFLKTTAIPFIKNVNKSKMMMADAAFVSKPDCGRVTQLNI
jgi:hypothetical protein